ncbi:hypothetical protein QYE76_025725 [Lolium multiflorum]|uniref:Uncharacterized protein n=1 Tax=Lolium multiflorum TaxID=4521 RepID=A0AAD8VXA4_LOLMU|nr:hypothetical protein QYE76_025725 [Lolium multiflorum]
MDARGVTWYTLLRCRYADGGGRRRLSCTWHHLGASAYGTAVEICRRPGRQHTSSSVEHIRSYADGAAVGTYPLVAIWEHSAIATPTAWPSAPMV